MNIADAKTQIKDAVEAYLQRDELGDYLIAPARQRPMFLLGAPGIGKTAIMEQIADEMDIGLVSYSMTHHTRQSALGLPMIEHHEYKGFSYEASEYTMSEIIASIYDYMTDTGLERGILFLDEINCVSETLYPSMLQFLQFKTFGRHRIPDDWVVVCAGNPPEYNKSVHEFDIVTLDRLRKVEVEPDYDAWRDYALEVGVHPAITTFLEIKKDRFYLVESTPSGKCFVTARGWSDLSETIKLSEKLGKRVDTQLVSQFVQDEETAEMFAQYYDLFNKYRSDYQVDKILDGCPGDEIVVRAHDAAFDERLALLGLLLDALNVQMSDAMNEERALVELRDCLREAKPRILDGGETAAVLGDIIAVREEQAAARAAAGNASSSKGRTARKVTARLRELEHASRMDDERSGAPAFALLQERFGQQTSAFAAQIARIEERLSHAFDFIDRAFANDREQLAFVAELTGRPSTARYLNRHGSESYYAHNDQLKIDAHQQDLFSRIDELALDELDN